MEIGMCLSADRRRLIQSHPKQSERHNQHNQSANESRNVVVQRSSWGVHMHKARLLDRHVC